MAEAKSSLTMIVLSAQKISKRFGGVQALKNITLVVKQGEIFGLMGPNGAGKTTLFNVITGYYRPDQGAISLAGRILPVGQPYKIAQRGLVRTFQNIRLFSEMSVLDNVRVGTHICSTQGLWGAIWPSGSVLAQEQELIQRSREYLAWMGLGQYEHRMARTLSYGQQRRLEIARALAAQPSLLALDEPAAGMNGQEREELGLMIKKIQQHGITIIVIEHDVRWMMGLCDRLMVLHHGECLAEGLPLEIQQHPEVIRAYLGTSEKAPRVR